MSRHKQENQVHTQKVSVIHLNTRTDMMNAGI